MVSTLTLGAEGPGSKHSLGTGFSKNSLCSPNSKLVPDSLQRGGRRVVPHLSSTSSLLGHSGQREQPYLPTLVSFFSQLHQSTLAPNSIGIHNAVKNAYSMLVRISDASLPPGHRSRNQVPWVTHSGIVLFHQTFNLIIILRTTPNG